MLSKFKLNIWDINFILTIVGFPFFTMLISDSLASIAYRAFAVFVSIVCLVKSGFHLPNIVRVKIYFILLLYISAQAYFGLFYGEYSLSPWNIPKMQFALFNVGVLFIPLVAFISGYDRLNKDRSVFVIFVMLFATILYTNINTYSVEAAHDGRYQMSRLSTLAYGDYSCYLALLSVSMMLKKSKESKLERIISVIFYIGFFVGIFGVFRAGSRGPLVSLFAGLFLLFCCMRFKIKLITIAFTLFLFFVGGFSMRTLEEYAPAMFYRLNYAIEEGDTGGRDVLFQEAIDKFYNNIIFGTNPIELEETQFTGAHNVYLEVLVGSGIVGIILFVIIISFTMWQIITLRSSYKSSFEYFVLSLFFCNIVRGMTGIMFTSNAIYSFVLLASIFIVYSKQLEHDSIID